MFDNLLETRRKKTRSAGGMLGSFVVHSLVIGGALWATASGTVAQLIEDKQEKVDFIKKEEPPPEVKPPPPDVVVAPPPPKGFQVLIAPVEIPDVLPEIDLSKKMTDEADFSGKGVAGGTSTGVVGGVPQMINTDQTYYEFQVEKPASQVSGIGVPVYPEMLKNAGFQGKVLASFVIDTTGKVDVATFKIISSSHDLFTKAVRDQLRNMKFLPAEVGGRKVKQLVQLPFEFSIR
ncbi:MAG TPA: energy transducer TonB [Gemmatimonadaceae bacterium]|nr:energy transducer TonB [Gemmatimonadaceae bacterium]